MSGFVLSSTTNTLPVPVCVILTKSVVVDPVISNAEPVNDVAFKLPVIAYEPVSCFEFM